MDLIGFPIVEAYLAGIITKKNRVPTNNGNLKICKGTVAVPRLDG